MPTAPDECKIVQVRTWLATKLADQHSIVKDPEALVERMLAIAENLGIAHDTTAKEDRTGNMVAALGGGAARSLCMNNKVYNNGIDCKTQTFLIL